VAGPITPPGDATEDFTTIDCCAAVLEGAGVASAAGEISAADDGATAVTAAVGAAVLHFTEFETALLFAS
jgi:hypothetical protein